MNDLISRQAAYDTLAEYYHLRTETQHKSLKEALSRVPSAQSERNLGKWIVVKRHEHYPSGKPYDQVQCPFCKRFDNNVDGSFCGYCGADMRGDENG